MHIKDDLERIITKVYKTLNRATITLASLTLIGLSAKYLEAQDWRTEIVDDEGRGRTSIVLDRQGRPRIAYTYIDEYGNRFVKYAALTDQGWQKDLLEETGNLGPYGGAPDIDLDSNDRASIVYYNYNNDSIEVISLNPDSTWSIKPIQTGVTSELESNAYPKIKIGSDDYKHIIYTDTFNEFDPTLKHAIYKDGNPEIEVVDHLGTGSDNKNDLTIDNNGNLQVVYYLRGNPYQGIGYATMINQIWSILPFISGGVSSSADISIDCDSTGTPYVSHRADGGSLICSYLAEPGSWPGWVVDSESDTTRMGFAQYSSTAIDNDGNPSIAYSGGYTEEELENILNFTSYNGQSWEEPTIVDPVAGYYVSLAISKTNNQPYIAYIYYSYTPEQGTDTELRCATRTTTGIEDNTSTTQLPKLFSLSQNYPNPFNPNTTINYSIPIDQNVSIKIYDLRGRYVKTLVDRIEPAGSHLIIWDGTDGQNQKQSSGNYFCVLETTQEKTIRKMVLSK